MQNSPRVARYLARFLRFLIENGVDINKLHLIGFSLGAEVAGFAGKILKEWKMELPRITGKLIYIKKTSMLFFRAGIESELNGSTLLASREEYSRNSQPRFRLPYLRTPPAIVVICFLSSFVPSSQFMTDENSMIKINFISDV